MKNLLLTLAGIACLSLTACDDDDDDMTNIGPTATRMEILTSQSWMLSPEIAQATDNTPAEFKINPFSRDDIFMFKINGDAIRDEGRTKEEGKPQIVEVSRWSFANEERNLNAAFRTLPLNDEIVELTRSRLVLRRTVNDIERLTTFVAVQ